MTDEQPPINDIVDEALGKALGRLLHGSHLEKTAAELDLTMERAFMVADPEARPIIIGQVNVLKVMHNWIARLADDPDDGIRLDQAIREIQGAIFAGMRGERYV
jgi:hypothetical protein